MGWDYRISIFFLSATVLLGIAGFPLELDYLIPNYNISNQSLQRPIISLGEKKIAPQFATSTMFITGDVLLARHVETLIKSYDEMYPYKNLSFLKEVPAYVLVNFESSIPLIHKKTPNQVMQFSTNSDFIPALRDAGVTHVGIANNHSFDYGKNDFIHTKEIFTENQIISFGDPNQINNSSSIVLNLADKRIGILAIQALYGISNLDNLTEAMKGLSQYTDLQIIYVHWGTEYKQKPDTNQLKLATVLINLGADLIIGHHPHVVQSFELKGNVPIFYSLGNFIFDQYFSENVQEGLVIKIEADNKGLKILPLAVTSKDSHAAPRLMNESESANFVDRLNLESTNFNLSNLFKIGLIVPWPLASSTEMAIMTR